MREQAVPIDKSERCLDVFNFLPLIFYFPPFLISTSCKNESRNKLLYSRKRNERDI